MKQNKSKSLFQRGQSVVEFALTLPILALVFSGVFEFGLFFLINHTVQNASREGARFAVDLTNLQVNDQRVIDHVELILPDTDLFSVVEDGVTSTVPDCSADGEVTVTISGNYSFTFLSIIGLDQIAMNVPTAMRHESCGNNFSGSGGGGGSGGSGGGGGGVGTLCFHLTTGHTGPGDDPVFSPAGSSGCLTGYFNESEVVTLTANPDSGYVIGGWTGTDDDASKSTTNQLTMPPNYASVSVDYVPPPCYILSLDKTGDGSVPAASPEKSPQCDNPDEYIAGQSISLTATPDSGNTVTGWSGTDNDSSILGTNTLTMPDNDHAASVYYDALVCYSLSTSHTGNGNNPVPSAANCPGGLYYEGTVVNLNAQPDLGWGVTGWTNTANDGSTSTTNSVSMTSDKSVSVTYAVDTVIAQPLNVYIPNNSGEWSWVYSGWWGWSSYCSKIDLRWSDNPAWSQSPHHYEVYRVGSGWGDDQYDHHWNANHTIGWGSQITLGVRAVFPGGVTSQTQEVTYACLYQDLVFWGSVVK